MRRLLPDGILEQWTAFTPSRKSGHFDAFAIWRHGSGSDKYRAAFILQVESFSWHRNGYGALHMSARGIARFVRGTARCADGDSRCIVSRPSGFFDLHVLHAGDEQ